MARTLISQLAELIGERVTVRAWVQALRDQKRMQFLILRDESARRTENTNFDADRLSSSVKAKAIGCLEIASDTTTWKSECRRIWRCRNSAYRQCDSLSQGIARYFGRRPVSSPGY